MRNLRNLRNLRGFRLSGGLPSGVRFFSKIVQKWGSHFRPPFEYLWGPQKWQKIDPGRIFRGLGGGPKNGPPSRGPKSEILQLFTTLELGPTSQKGTPFWSHFGDLFCQKNEKRGFQKRTKNQSQKIFKMGPKQGGGVKPSLGSPPQAKKK